MIITTGNSTLYSHIKPSFDLQIHSMDGWSDIHPPHLHTWPGSQKSKPRAEFIQPLASLAARAKIFARRRGGCLIQKKRKKQGCAVNSLSFCVDQYDRILLLSIEIQRGGAREVRLRWRKVVPSTTW